MFRYFNSIFPPTRDNSQSFILTVHSNCCPENSFHIVFLNFASYYHVALGTLFIEVPNPSKVLRMPSVLLTTSTSLWRKNGRKRNWINFLTFTNIQNNNGPAWDLFRPEMLNGQQSQRKVPLDGLGLDNLSTDSKCLNYLLK